MATAAKGTSKAASEAQTAFQAGELHPGDLKPAVRDAVDEILGRVRAKVSGDAELAKAEKELQKVAKRQGAAKGKK